MLYNRRLLQFYKRRNVYRAHRPVYFFCGVLPLLHLPLRILDSIFLFNSDFFTIVLLFGATLLISSTINYPYYSGNFLFLDFFYTILDSIKISKLMLAESCTLPGLKINGRFLLVDLKMWGQGLLMGFRFRFR